MKGSPTKSICFFNSNKAWGGGEKWHFTMCQELSKAGFNTFIVTNTHSQIGLKATKERLQHFAFQISSLSFINPIKVFLLMMFFRMKKIDTLIETNHDDINNLMNVYISISSQRTNEVMRTLTVFTAFFLPTTFIVGVYGMNFENMPELQHPYGYPAVLGFMLLVTILIYTWFKRKGWM